MIILPVRSTMKIKNYGNYGNFCRFSLQPNFMIIMIISFDSHNYLKFLIIMTISFTIPPSKALTQT